jgi:hypothetical protein
LPEGFHEGVSAMLDPSISENLTSEDDPRLWDLAVSTILTDAEESCRGVEQDIFAQVGCCRHWISPHRPIRWRAGGGFAWPFGYDKTSTAAFYSALPELEWSRFIRWTGTGWELRQRTGKRCLVLRISVPYRTAKHLQAAIHTVWTPRSPLGTEKVVQPYGFRKVQGIWSFTATEVFRPRRR